MSIFLYRRPAKVARLPGPMTQSQCQIYVDRTQLHKRFIPRELSFDNVIQNKALPPCTLQDFLEYLTYVSHEAENLQFYLWLQDYTKRFDMLSHSTQVLSPPWKEPESSSRGTSSQTPPSSSDSSKARTLYGDSINFDNIMPQRIDTSIFNDGRSLLSETTRVSTPNSIGSGNAAIGLAWQSFTIQPFRPEIDRIIKHYILPSSPCELNISYRDREKLLHALQNTTHPTAFTPILQIITSNLRNQAHPNFIRYSICNGNKPRVRFVKTCGVIHLLIALTLAILLILSHASRWWRTTTFPLFFVGFDILIAAHKGLCVVIHASHNRALRPWEQFPPTSSSIGLSSLASNPSFDHVGHAETGPLPATAFTTRKPPSRQILSLDTLDTPNTSASSPWVRSYDSQPLIRKIFAPTVRVQEEAVRVLQDRIVLGCHAQAGVASLLVVVLVVGVPGGVLF